MKMLLVLSLFLFFLLQCGQVKMLEERLKDMDGIEFLSIPPDSTFSQAYEMIMVQPLDHQDSSAGFFKQKIVLQHAGFDRPVVLITEGYAMRHNFTRELSELLSANEIRVEHRYFGDSTPDSMKWEYLTTKQAAYDHHKIVKAFKKNYPGAWINTGWSKGGQTAIFHKYYFPNDIQATVAYDAPFNFSDREERIDRFFSLVGSQNCRDRLKTFQRAALKRKPELLKLMDDLVSEKNYHFSIGMEAALEYVILEYPFSFWQYHKMDCMVIPGEESAAQDIFDHLKQIVSFSSYSDRALNSTAMYQFFTELGYYGYVTDGLEKWLSGAYGYTNAIFAPETARGKYSPELMKKINAWLQTEGNKMMYIYGENDPWSASGVEIPGQVEAFRFNLQGGNHYTFIRSFPDEERAIILSMLKDWANAVGR